MSEEPGLNDWPRAHGGPVAQGVLRTEAEDFIVEEQLGFAPDGVGDHVWLYIEKRHANTHWVARKLAELAWVAPSEVGFAGLKDRHALTRQWFSVALCGNKEPDWTALNSTEMRVWEVVRHRHKLRRGDHQANRFQIRLRDFRGDAGKCEEVLRRITEQGFPNYFGEQRFGNDNGNLKAAREWFTGELMPQRSERGFYLSAIRALLFNQVLARRVELTNWNRPIPGDLMESTDSGHCFPVIRLDEGVRERCDALSITPTGPLYGAGQPKPSREAGDLERAVLKSEVFWTRGLEKERMRADRRVLRAVARNLEWTVGYDVLELGFELGTGSYATSLMREVVAW